MGGGYTLASPIEKRLYSVFLTSSLLIALPFVIMAVMLINQMTQLLSQEETSKLESLSKKVFQEDIENRKELLEIYSKASQAERKHIERILGKVEIIHPKEKIPEGFYQSEDDGKLWLIYSDGEKLYKSALPEETVEALKAVEKHPLFKGPIGIMKFRSYIPAMIFVEIILIVLTLSLERRLAKKMANPLQKIEHSTRRIALGDLEVEIPHSTGIAEIDSLSESMEKMKQEMQKYRESSAKAREAHLWEKIAREIAHEINNPLTAIKMSMQLLERTKNLPEDVKQKTSLVLEEVQKLKNSVEKILSARKTLELEPVDALKEIREIVELYSTAFPSKKVSVEGKPAKVMADPALLRRILVNLLKNALEVADEIKIKLMEEDGFIKVAFMDNGPGVPEEKVTRLFKESFTTKEKGSGIG